MRFNDVEIVDKKKALVYTSKLFKFFAEMQKSKEHLKLKPVVVKKAKSVTATTAVAPSRNIKSNLAQKRIDLLLNKKPG